MSDLKDIREELSENSEENQEQQYENMNLEDLVSQLQQDAALNPIELNVDNLTDIEINKDNFSKGLKDISYTCGMLTGLINIGLSPKDALDYVLNQENINHNQRLQDKINNNNIEVSKIQQLKIEQQVL
jgi:type II secretory pathway component PulF